MLRTDLYRQRNILRHWSEFPQGPASSNFPARPSGQPGPVVSHLLTFPAVTIESASLLCAKQQGVLHAWQDSQQPSLQPDVLGLRNTGARTKTRRQNLRPQSG